jgi:cytochrome P450
MATYDRGGRATDLTVADAAQLFVNPASYTDEAALHAALALLREKAPVVRIEHPSFRPFWAVTKYADIVEVLRNHELWLNGPRSILQTTEIDDAMEAMRDAGVGLRNLEHIDGAYHRALRAIGAEWFRPKVMRSLKRRIDELAAHYVDFMAQTGTECEFVGDVATAYPGYVILSLLGLPESDFPRLLGWTQELFGLDDDERRRGQRSEDMVEVVADFVEYFRDLAAQRRKNPTDDIASAIANARIDGELLTEMEVVSYYQVISSAGHDTTKAAIAGGLLALIENPGEHARLRGDLTLMPTAVEEIIRWSTPVKTFMRTASHDTVIRGVSIAAGESVCLSYPSANRDGDVFTEPSRFDVGRDPNRHLGFGSGVHFCLGAALARMEMGSFFRHLIPLQASDSSASVNRVSYRAQILADHLRRWPQAPIGAIFDALKDVRPAFAARGRKRPPDSQMVIRCPDHIIRNTSFPAFSAWPSRSGAHLVAVRR